MRENIDLPQSYDVSIFKCKSGYCVYLWERRHIKWGDSVYRSYAGNLFKCCMVYLWFTIIAAFK